MSVTVEKFVVLHAHQTSVFGLAPAARWDLAQRRGPTAVFSEGLDQYLWFPSVVSSAYNSSGLSVRIHGDCPSAGDIVLEVAYEPHVDGVTDLSIGNFQPPVQARLSVPTGGFVRSVTFTVTHAQTGGMLAGQTYRLRLGRLGTATDDTNPGVFYFMGYEANTLA